MASKNIKNIYKILKAYGIDRKFMSKVLLPDWWSEDVAETQIGYMQTLSILSKNLSINIDNLLKQSKILTHVNSLDIKFKTSKNIEIERNSFWVQSLASRITDIIEETYLRDKIKQEFYMKPDVLRNYLLEIYGEINLVNILDYLWKCGIPVVFISEFPKDLYKMDGMIIKTKSKPIITISKNRKHDSWLLFIILHELGHYISGHLKNDNIVFDEGMDYADIDKEENEANEIALYLITGFEKPNLVRDRLDSSFQLVNISRTISKQIYADAGSIVLNYAFHFNNFVLAEQALKILDPRANAIEKVKKYMLDNLDLNRINEENKQYFLSLSNIENI